MVLWNTRYLDAALTALREAGTQVKDEDLARLSPLKARHLNVLGRYSFLPSVPGGGILRPLRDPADADAETEDDL
ncbi:Tn3 family transposase [Streptomyces lasiicapitis]|uniref:Tn3 family transposase n=1 Tax=Streptomyces lasiicapitis TaxID=1923961 RepID=UPI00367D984D